MYAAGGIGSNQQDVGHKVFDGMDDDDDCEGEEDSSDEEEQDSN